ncbi:hypothetical protein [Flavobacterium cheniae]|uniref:Uncharacterized protein n=1 Tax=Flavobacterium cheniae TaxID=295428 RepID=A0A562KB36_9FLAO|nr:hypothetical protein [Flavobacterium cheniae]TDR24077.1 hypothetical protein C8D80_1106 [Flavobacterium cheniae]TWH92641.1 hypothetical protein IP97_02385 [Flavobacterium cheniae]
MEPNKIDNQIREKLNAREVQPSAQAWDRLDAMLAVSEEKKSKKGYGWFFVAASTILFFGLGFFLFNSNETKEINNSNPIVTTINEVMDSTEANKINQISVEKEQPVLVQNEVNYSKTQKNKKSKETNELIKEETSTKDNSSSIIHHPSPNSYKYVSPENLLAEVETGEKVITSDKKISPKAKMKVDANSLLTNVEKELDENHRETTLDKLNRKFKDAKSALANRNYE